MEEIVEINESSRIYQPLASDTLNIVTGAAYLILILIKYPRIVK